jgi:lipopolysaccharide/colanic/teichoic acid biosynthesis glycosyltransferase
VAALAIIVTDGRPVIFRQVRVGRNGRPFDIWKLRTMRDGSVISVGRWLRVTGLDESLQFINVLHGTMAMVGPRPLTREDIIRLGFDSAVHRKRWEVTPGITGLAQLLGTRSGEEARRWEARYAARSSARLDLAILALSALANLIGKRRVNAVLRRFVPLAARWRDAAAPKDADA